MSRGRPPATNIQSEVVHISEAKKEVCTFCQANSHNRCLGGSCKCGHFSHHKEPVSMAVVSKGFDSEPEFKWEEPPSRGETRLPVGRDVLAELKKFPNRWARVKTFETKHGVQYYKTKFKEGKLADLKEEGGEWELKAVVKSGYSVLYLRCLKP